MKTQILSIIAVALLMASCGTQKQVAKDDAIKNIVISPPSGIEVMDTVTKVFVSLKLPKNDYWIIKNKDATFRYDEFLVKKRDPSNGEVAIIRTLSYGKFSTDLNNVTDVVKSIDNYMAGFIIKYNDFHFKSDGEGNKIEDPVHTTKLDTLANGYIVVVVESEVKNTREKHRFFGRSYYARNYYFLAKKDEKNCIPIISSSVMLLPDNYETEKQKFIDLVDYVVNTAVLQPEYKFKN